MWMAKTEIYCLVTISHKLCDIKYLAQVFVFFLKNQLNFHFKYLFSTFAYVWGKEKKNLLEEKNHWLQTVFCELPL
jgi:hypothetical protein